MVTVAAKELKNRLGKYLKLVRVGEVVRITDRGRPIGCIFPSVSPETDEVLARILSKGGVRLGTGERLRPHPVILKPGRSTTAMIAGNRR
jgi:prevent-host-death family protein